MAFLRKAHTFTPFRGRMDIHTLAFPVRADNARPHHGSFETKHTFHAKVHFITLTGKTNVTCVTFAALSRENVS